jgi:hypothetical protein
MKKNINLKNCIIGLLLLVIIFLKFCSKPEVITNPKVITNTQIDTFYKDTGSIVYKKGKNLIIKDSIRFEVPVDVDTNKILEEFYTQYIYNDTLNLVDSLGYVTVIDTIFKNRIYSRKYESNIRQKIIKEVFYVQEPIVNEYYLGANIGFNYLGTSFIFKNKNNKMYSLGLGITPDVNKKMSTLIVGGIYYKIK